MVMMKDETTNGQCNISTPFSCPFRIAFREFSPGELCSCTTQMWRSFHNPIAGYYPFRKTLGYNNTRCLLLFVAIYCTYSRRFTQRHKTQSIVALALESVLSSNIIRLHIYIYMYISSNTLMMHTHSFVFSHAIGRQCVMLNNCV